MWQWRHGNVVMMVNGIAKREKNSMGNKEFNT
jgi:hypothetical protein